MGGIENEGEGRFGANYFVNILHSLFHLRARFIYSASIDLIVEPNRR